jgi:hypothetical protein
MTSITRVVVLLFAFISFTATGFAEENMLRKANVQRYFDQFFPPGIAEDYPKIYKAVYEVFMKLPENVFNEITKHEYPVLFTINMTSGIGRFANSTQMSVHKKDHETLREGFYLIKLSDELEHTPDFEAIEGIVFHELGHRYLNHLRQPIFSCEMEREANRLVKKWGFEKEYKKAKEAFGSKTPSDSPCHDTSATATPPT